MSPQALLPDEFASAIAEPSSPSDPPDELAATVSAAMHRRHPDLLELHSDSYAAPVATALYLYRRDQKTHRGLVLQSLGTPAAPEFCQRVAAAARDAWQHQDWRLLGRLCYRFELARATTRWPDWSSFDSSQPRFEEPAAQSARSLVADTEMSDPLRMAFLKALDFERGVVPADGYVRCAIGYFSSLPAHFTLPPQCLAASDTIETDDWKVLSMLCVRHALAWQSVPGAWDALLQLNQPLLQHVVERLSRPVHGQPPRSRRLKNPFTALAGALALEPVQRRRARRIAPQSFRGASDAG